MAAGAAVGTLWAIIESGGAVAGALEITLGGV